MKEIKFMMHTKWENDFFFFKKIIEYNENFDLKQWIISWLFTLTKTWSLNKRTLMIGVHAYDI